MSISMKISELLKHRLSISPLKQIHAQIIVHSLSSHPPLISSLIHRYLPLKSLNSCAILLESYPSSTSPPTFLWNLLIRSESKNPNSLQSLTYFARMLAAGSNSMVRPDDYTYTFTLTACSRQDWHGYGYLVHGLVIRAGFESGLCIANAMINMYSVFGDLGSARKVFDEMSERDVFSWTSLLGGYAKNGEIDNACDVFDRMPARNEVSWGVMISGLVSNERNVEAIDCLRRMLAEDRLKPNEAALVCALSACAQLGALEMGLWIENYVKRASMADSSYICTGLIDMYAKCGRIDSARVAFDRIQNPDVHNYTSMISGLAIHGLGKEAIELFDRMVKKGVRPSDITLIGVLNGCNHSGLVDEGSRIFNEIERLCGHKPKIAHYGAYIDLLARAGYLEKAYETVRSMPMDPDDIIWRALLSACRIHRNIALGKEIIDRVRRNKSSAVTNGDVLLSNLYASFGEWEDVKGLRKSMVKGSNPGCSWVEVNGAIHEFRVDEQLHPQISEIRKKLSEMMEKARGLGYVASVMQVGFDLSEEDKAEAMARHSEKLAVAFVLLEGNEPGGVIRVVKNLRTCVDCHGFLKAVSVAYEREIVVRDRCRFHAFRAGKCSCNDYW